MVWIVLSWLCVNWVFGLIENLFICVEFVC